MKKGRIAAFTLMAAALVAVTGCGAGASKKLVCTTKVSGVDVTFIVKFEGKKVKEMDFAYDMDLSSYSDAQISAIEGQELCPTIKQSFTGYQDAFKNCKQKVESKHLKIVADLDVSKLSSDVKDTMVSPEKAKEGLEKTGFTCTIK